MQRSAVVLLVLAACGPTELPGWYDVPDEPASRFFGSVSLTFEQGVLNGEVTGTDAFPQHGVYFAMKWPGAAPMVVAGGSSRGALRPTMTFSVPLEPPRVAQQPTPDGCASAKGTVLVFALGPTGIPAPDTDVLVGASKKPTWLFTWAQAAYDRPLEWTSCAGTKQHLTVLLQHDDRLALALCEGAAHEAVELCGRPALDRTRVDAVDVTVEEGTVSLAPSFVATHRAPITTLINGVELKFEAGRLSTPVGPPWRPGRNRVTIRQGDLAPWEADVVLPLDSLRPRTTSRFSAGSQVEVVWDEAPWAQSYRLSTEPLDVAPARVAHPWWQTSKPSVRDTFPGFVDGRGDSIRTTRARLTVTATGSLPHDAPVAFHGGGSFSVTWREGLTVSTEAPHTR